MDYIDRSSPAYNEFDKAEKTLVAEYFPDIEWPPGVEPVGIGIERHLYFDAKGDWYVLERYYTWGGVAGGELFALTPEEARQTLEKQGLQTPLDKYFPERTDGI